MHAVPGGALFTAASWYPFLWGHLGRAQDLQEWRKRLNSQVQGYQVEIGGLRSKLLAEMEALKAEFLGLRTTLKQQMAATWADVGRPPEAPAAPTSEVAVEPQAAEDA